MLRLLLINTALWFWSLLPSITCCIQLRSFILYLGCQLFSSRIIFSPQVYTVPNTVFMWGHSYRVKICMEGKSGSRVWKSEFTWERFRLVGNINKLKGEEVIFIIVHHIIVLCLLFRKGWWGKWSKSHEMDTQFPKRSETIYSSVDFPTLLQIEHSHNHVLLKPWLKVH